MNIKVPSKLRNRLDSQDGAQTRRSKTCAIKRTSRRRYVPVLGPTSGRRSARGDGTTTNRTGRSTATAPNRKARESGRTIAGQKRRNHARTRATRTATRNLTTAFGPDITSSTKGRHLDSTIRQRRGKEATRTGHATGATVKQKGSKDTHSTGCVGLPEQEGKTANHGYNDADE